jgi:transposase-like protein
MGKQKSLDEVFTVRRSDRDVIIPCVRWYRRYKLSLRDLVEMMAVVAVRPLEKDREVLRVVW